MFDKNYELLVAKGWNLATKSINKVEQYVLIMSESGRFWDLYILQAQCTPHYCELPTTLS